MVPDFAHVSLTPEIPLPNQVFPVWHIGGALYCDPFRHVVPDDPGQVRVMAALIHEPPRILLSDRDGPENLL